jgi:DNA-binding NarL/FixJ family response regulator
MAVTVLIVDDHALFRKWARVLLEQAGYAVLGDAADGASAIEEASRTRPEVVLLDIRLPDIDGFEVAERLIAQPSPPIVVLISTADASDYGERISRSRALGFLTKDELTAESLATLLAARDGGNLIPETAAEE